MSCASVDPLDAVRRQVRRDDLERWVRPLVRSILENWTRHSWSLQGFGMLRTYVSRELRLHVWDRRFAVSGVSTIHDHPWNFESSVVVGRIVNTRYRVHPCTHTDAQVDALRLRSPFVKMRIVCGPGGGADRTMLAQRSRVWLEPVEPETYEAGSTYRQEASEVHHTSYDDGTVTLVDREFLPDAEHAHVFYRAGEEWVSAEPREATPDEVSTIVERALAGF